jgi:hypothetical protein
MEPGGKNTQYDESYAIAQAVNRKLPRTTAQVRPQVLLYGISDGELALGRGFSKYFQIVFQQTAPLLLIVLSSDRM